MTAIPKVAAVDIGTNSMRLLMIQQVGDGTVELGRWERVTGLGTGVDGSGRLSEEAIDRTLLALAEFGARMNKAGVAKRRAVATSAARDASNREKFFDKAELALGVRPELISGKEEASLAFAGATAGRTGASLVIDIGGGSTEFVTAAGGTSYDIGSVRLTDRVLSPRPATIEQLTAARAMVAESFIGVALFAGPVLGVAGTWTSLASIEGTDALMLSAITAWIDRLAGMSIEETAAIPGLDPARAPVILAGAVVAEGALTAVGAASIEVSKHDLLDGITARLLTAGS
ncbi:MAG: exopolyphosphatase [Actinobacteria bacterium]|nr:exopolyphosphatase [Actinomycetota bacterium]